MLEAFANWVSKFIKVKPQPGYLDRDMAQHRVHSKNMKIFASNYDGGEIGSTDTRRQWRIKNVNANDNFAPQDYALAA